MNLGSEMSRGHAVLGQMARGEPEVTVIRTGRRGRPMSLYPGPVALRVRRHRQRLKEQGK